MDIEFKRNINQYLWTYFLPSLCTLLLAGCSFIVPPTAIPGRLALLVTLFLVEMEILKNVQSLVPDTVTLLSFYAHFALSFVISAFLEYAFILLMERLKLFSRIMEVSSTGMIGKLISHWNAEWIDFASMTVYFALMIILNIAYISYAIYIRS